MSVLKDCPHCGIIGYPQPYDNGAQIRCEKCGMMGPRSEWDPRDVDYVSRLLAEKLWNELPRKRK